MGFAAARIKRRVLVGTRGREGGRDICLYGGKRCLEGTYSSIDWKKVLNKAELCRRSDRQVALRA